MNSEQVIATVCVHETELRRRGVMHAALFGSVARNEAMPTSDIDIMIALEPGAPVGLFEYVDITQYLADLFPKSCGCRESRASRSTAKSSRISR